MVTNVMQLVNFSSNFLLYCAINPKFRAAAQGLVLDACCPWKKNNKHRLVADRSTDRSMTQGSVAGGGARGAGQWKSPYSSRSTGTTGGLGSYQQISTSANSQM